MDIREDLIRHYHWLRQYGYNDSHSGNASVRDDDGLWVTPTGSCADTLQAHDLILCPVDGNPMPGVSLDAPLHQRVYRSNPEARALLHSHGPYTVAMTLDGQDFCPPDFEGWHYFKRVRVVTVAYEDYTRDAPARVAEVLADHPVVVVRGHGVFACAPSLNLAYKWTCSLESSAKTAFIARQAGTWRG